MPDQEARSTDANSATAIKDKITDRAILKAVEIEFDRTLPFWRCFVDLRHGEDTKKVLPAVMSRETVIACRLPCRVFEGVEVVWAKTTVRLRTPLKDSNAKKYSSHDPAVSLTRYWREIPFREEAYTLGTMHFVHTDAHKKGGAGGDRSFHIQSVVLEDDPSLLQCVAGTMISFTFMAYSSLRLLAERRQKGKTFNPLSDRNGVATPEKLRATYFPSASSRVLILGMGGNSMALCLRRVLGPRCEIHVVEMEPTVVDVCRRVGTLMPDDAQLHVHIAEATAFLRSRIAATELFDMVFMDLFEPMNAKMDISESLVHLCEQHLRPGGLLVVNDHQLPSPSTLRSFCDLVGAENVQAVNLHGWKESVVVCVKPGDPDTEGLSAHCHKLIAGVVFDIYEVICPGWLPHFSWLKTCARVPHGTGCRIWTS